MMHINRGPFLSHTVMLPPLREQDSIVSTLNELMSRCDQLEAAQEEREIRRGALRSVSLHRLTTDSASGPADVRFFLDQFPRLLTRPEHVSAVRQTILDLAVRGRLVRPDSGDASVALLIEQLVAERAQFGRRVSRETAQPESAWPAVPVQWGMTVVSHLASSIDYGTSQKATLDPSGIPVLRMGNIWHGSVVLDRLKYVGREAIHDDLLLNAGDLLFNRTNSAELVGKNAVFLGADGPVTFASYLIRVKPLPSSNMRWVNIALMSSYGQEYLGSVRSQQTGQANINGTKLAAAPIPLPPLAEQLRIMAKVDELMTVCDELAVALTSARDGRGRLLESLLSDEFSGTDEDVAAGYVAAAV
jgi:type I restriction enzyme S subunit